MAGSKGKASAGQQVRSDLAGVMVLAIGLASLLGVGAYGVVKYMRQGAHKASLTVQSSGAAPGESYIDYEKRRINEKLPQAINHLDKPSFASLKGSWVLKYGTNGVATLVLADNFFQLVTTTDKQGRLRQYSRGIVEYDQRYGKLRLIPTNEAGEPDPIKGVTYKVLTMRAYDVFVSMKKGDPALYLTPPEDQLVGRTFHPLFLQVDYKGAPVLKWVRAK